MTEDYERIWLEHPDTADPHNGRMWCEDRVWPDDAEDGEPTEYVRADLLRAKEERIAAILKEALDWKGMYLACAKDRDALFAKFSTALKAFERIADFEPDKRHEEFACDIVKIARATLKEVGGGDE